MRSTCVIEAVGMVTALGLSAAQCAAGVRAGLSRARQMPELYYCLASEPALQDAEPLVACPIEFAPRSYVGPGRAGGGSGGEKWLGALAAMAYTDLERGLPIGAARDGDVALLLAAPSTRAAMVADFSDQVLLAFHNYAERDLGARTQVVRGGHDCALEALAMGIALLQGGAAERVVVGAVDSWLRAEWLSPLDEDLRLKSARAFGGMCPGEAAAFLSLRLERDRGSDLPALERKSARESERRGPLARIHSLGACADATAASGVVLATALAGALEGGAGRGSPEPSVPGAMPWVVGDPNGEPRRMDDWGWAQARLGERLPRPNKLLHPAIGWGDVGAATGAVLLALAAQLVQQPRHRRALVFCSSDTGSSRAALIETCT